MEEKIRVAFLLLATVSSLSAASTIFFHERSFVQIHAHLHKNHSDFGFAMGFHTKNKTLIIGAPRESLEGKVYTCDMKNGVEHKEITCKEKSVPLNHAVLTEKSKELAHQHFFLGSTIAVSSKYFVTCAPLVTKSLPSIIDALDAVGTCFILNESPKRPRVRMMFSQLKSKRDSGEEVSKILNNVVSGTGWTTLVDEDNGVLLIGKTSNTGDILHTPVDEPSRNAKYMGIDDKVSFSTESFFNVGFGITSGKFFSNKTVYAFSMMTKRMYGVIEFLEYNGAEHGNEKLIAMNPKIDFKQYTIRSKTIASMFGSALTAADINMDGSADLLVAAPAHTEENCVECGALHLYLGGNIKTIGDDKMALQILGVKEYSRFSTAIVGKDLDGDGKPEIIVSAPYEDEGLGAVYILSGEELNSKLPQQSAQAQALVTTALLLSDLKNTQKIQKSDFRTLGFSLQFISDENDNGCSELVVGSPGSSNALLLKGIQFIKVTLSSKVIGNQVRALDNNFTMEVSVVVDYPHLPTSIYAHLTVTNSIIDPNTKLSNRSHEFDISCSNGSRNLTFAQKFTVFLTEQEEGHYEFSSEAKLHTDHIFSSSVFNNSWVVASSDSTLFTNTTVNRQATDADRYPRLSMEISWSGRDPYVHGSTPNETFVIKVVNTGLRWFGACVWVNITGGIVSRSINDEPYNDGYKYILPKPFKAAVPELITLPLIMTKPVNVFPKLIIEAFLYTTCEDPASSDSTKNKTIEYKFNTDDIAVNSAPVYKNVTDKLLQDPNFSFIDDQEYQIVNNGIVRWEKIVTIISMKKEPFITSFKVSHEAMNCQVQHTMEAYTYSCYINLLPNTTKKIITTAKILKSKVEKNLVNGSLITSSRLELFLQPTSDKKETTAITFTRYQKELTLGNAMWLIIVIGTLVGALVLIVIITVLYRCGFFKRKEKQKLHVLRESIKRRNSRRDSFISMAAREQRQSGKDSRRNTRSSAAAGITEEEIGDVGEDEVFEVVELSKSK